MHNCGFRGTELPLDSASTLMSGSEDQNPLHFLCYEHMSPFSLHTPAYQLFDSAYKDNLTELKSQLIELIESEKQVIITGAALGGSVASLFTLWLLEKVESKFKRPLCITFGSPLLGDASLQHILKKSWMNSCFLHVADAAQTPIMARFKPFGTFLICFGSQYICIDDLEVVTELLGVADTGTLGWRDYGEVLGRLDSRSMIDDSVINVLAEHAAIKKRLSSLLDTKKLNGAKIHIIYLEVYKKKSNKVKMGYYDWYKRHMKSPDSKVDMDIKKRKRELDHYWKELVEEVEKMPLRKKSPFNRWCYLSSASDDYSRWCYLSSANEYRRLVEPLDIAEYYLSGRGDYRTTGRSRHYVLLEKWCKAEMEKQLRWIWRDQSDLSTFDPCFWAEVEEAKIATNTLKKQVVGKNVLLQKFAWFKEAMIGTNALKKQEVGRDVLLQKLAWFEEDAREMIRKGEEPPEILFERSSFMKWWREYTEIKRLTFYTL